MALRMLNYLTNFYMDYVASYQDVTYLPPVFPIVLYNGDRRWTAPVKMETLIRDVGVLGKYGVRFQYFKSVEHEYPQRAAPEDPQYCLAALFGGSVL